MGECGGGGAVLEEKQGGEVGKRGGSHGSAHPVHWLPLPAGPAPPLLPCACLDAWAGCRGWLMAEW